MVTFSTLIFFTPIEASTKVFSNARGITNMATLSTGPFAVRAVETPSVSNTQLGRNALRKRQTEFTRSTDNGGVASPSLFQTADGRIFALSNGRNAQHFAPGQIFQSSDGRFFTIAAVGSSPAKEPSPKRTSSPVVKSSAPLFQGQTKMNEITDSREKSAAKINDIRPTLSSTSLPSMIPTTTASTPTTKPASSRDLDIIPSTTPPPQKTEVKDIKTQPTSSSKVLSSFNDIFGKRTKPLVIPSKLPVTTAQQRLPNQNAVSSFDLRKIARKNKSLSDSVARDSNLQLFESIEAKRQKQDQEIQREQQLQQELRLQIQQQELRLKRLRQMQLELQRKQESREQELLQRHKKNQEILRMQQQKQLEELDRQQKLQLEQLQKRHEEEQRSNLAQITQKQPFDELKSASDVITKTKVIASAPLTPATSRFIALPAVPRTRKLSLTANTDIDKDKILTSSSVHNEIRQGKNIVPQEPTKQQLEKTLIPKTQRAITRVKLGRRVNRFKGRQKLPVNLSRTRPGVLLPSKIVTAPTLASSSPTNAIVAGYFALPSSGVYYNF